MPSRLLTRYRDCRQNQRRGAPTISLRTVVTVVSTALLMPVLIGLGAKWSGSLESRDQLLATKDALEVENTNFRETTGELTTQIESLEGVINESEPGRRSTRPRRAPWRSCQRSSRPERPGGRRGPMRPCRTSCQPRLPRQRTHSACFGPSCRVSKAVWRNVRKDVERQEQLAAAHPLHLAGPRLADRDLRGAVRTRSPASPVFIRASIFPPTRATRCSRPPTAGVESGHLHGRLWQPDRAPPRFRPPRRNTVTEPLQREVRRDGASRRHHRLRRLDGPIDRRPPALRNSPPTAT